MAMIMIGETARLFVSTAVPDFFECTYGLWADIALGKGVQFALAISRVSRW